MAEYSIAIGSNWERRQNMLLARRRLAEGFPDIRFSPEEETLPLGLAHSAPFCNQVARFTSPLTPDEVVERLKAIEHESGRNPAETAEEIVRLDLDLLMADGRVLRPEDCARDYVQRGLAALEQGDN